MPLLQFGTPTQNRRAGALYQQPTKRLRRVGTANAVCNRYGIVVWKHQSPAYVRMRPIAFVSLDRRREPSTNGGEIILQCPRRFLGQGLARRAFHPSRR